MPNLQTIDGQLKTTGAGSADDPKVLHTHVDSAPAAWPVVLVPKGYQQIADVSEAVGLSVPVGAVYALIQAAAKGVRWRDDGEDPTATVGMPIAAEADVFYTGDLAAIRFIEVEQSAELNVSYYGVE